VARYDPAGVNGLRPTHRSHIARVRLRGPRDAPAEVDARA
jgi:hypothetical protein